MKRILPYLLLNVVISAVTMLAVLLLWQAAHSRAAAPVQVNPATGSAGVTSPTKVSYEEASIEILAVIGAGDIQFEAVTLKNTGKNAVDLAGWSLRDAGGKQFTFPAFTVFPGGAFQVYSRSGVNTSLELYWGQPTAVWSSGTSVLLYDPSGTKRVEFQIP